jgi:multicomponent Na+:H+ antiporter subunit F
VTAPPLLVEVLLTAIAAAFLLAFVRIVIGRSLPDRVVAIDLMFTAAVAAAGLVCLASGRVVFLDVAVVIALISFVGTVAFAAYLERQYPGGGR